MDLTEALKVETVPPVPVARRKRGRPAAKNAYAAAAAATSAKLAAAVDVPAPVETLSQAEIQELRLRIDQLQARWDADPGDLTAEQTLREILLEHGRALKSSLRPDNNMHPDISAYNPLGERDHPRPKLRRPVFFLGFPVEHASLSRDEIELFNSFTESVETADGRKKVAVLKDGGGGECLYVSVPHRSADDLRGIGGLADICREVKTANRKAQTNDALLERIAALEAALGIGAAPPAPVATTATV